MGDFDDIYKKYFHDVFRYLRSITLNEALAEELTAETFFRAMTALDKFQGTCDIRVWLCQIAKNCYYSHYKKQKNNPQDGRADRRLTHSLEQMLVDKSTALSIHRILHNLNEPYKEVFSLRVFGELPFREIGQLFGKNEHWACVTYHRAKQRIQSEMEEDG